MNDEEVLNQFKNNMDASRRIVETMIKYSMNLDQCAKIIELSGPIIKDDKCLFIIPDPQDKPIKVVFT